jgi:hypothetical protein
MVYLLYGFFPCSVPVPATGRKVSQVYNIRRMD